MSDHLTVAEELKKAIDNILETIPQDREREIISRRFGLFDRKETLEQIGELLGVTRERIRQLEKSILAKLKSTSHQETLTAIAEIEKRLTSQLSESGRIAKVSDLTDKVLGKASSNEEKSQCAFIAELSPNLTLVNENDDFHQAVALSSFGTPKDVKKQVELVVAAIKKHGEPASPETLHQDLTFEHPSNVAALASVSKKLASLNGVWGLAKWPTVNPKNIRDKIFVVLAENNKPMHFSKIAKAIKDSSFKRRDVTTQAIHNELIKDPRFVLIGRGIYALDTWGYVEGTVSDVIAAVLKKSAEPLHRDEIVKRVLASRQVKETTILLNLQSKDRFKRVAKATYALSDAAPSSK